MRLSSKDQDEISKLYLEGFSSDSYRNSGHDDDRYSDEDLENNTIPTKSLDKYSIKNTQSVEDIVRSNISSGIDQLQSQDYNGRALLAHIENIFDTLDEENIEYDPYEIEPLIIQYIKES